MPATPDVFHLLLSDGAERLAHEGLPLAAAQALAPAAQEVLKADPIEFTEDQPTDRLLLHPEPSRRIAEGRMQALGVSSLVAVPQDLGPAEALRWAQASLPEGPSELLLLGEPERGISLAVQRVLSARHLVGRLPFHRVRELDDYAARLAAERRRPDALRPTLYTPRVGLGPLESAYQTLLHPILERLEEEGLSPRNASSGWTQPGDLDGLLDTPGTLLVHLDLGRGGDDPRVFGAPALGDAAAWRAKWIKQRHLWLPDGCWWLEASAGLGLPRPSGYAPLFDALGLSLPVEARATLPEAALANPNGPLAVFGPADHVPLLPPCQDADAEAIREAWIEARTELILALAQGLPVGLALFALRVEMHYALQALLPDSSTPEALGALGLAWAWVESLTLFADPAVCFTGDVSRVTEDSSAPELHVEEAVEAGSWSLILPDGDRFDARVQSLLPLVGRREAQTGQEARVLRYPAGRSDPSAWIERHVPAGLTPPPQLVLVGDAEELPFALQLALAERARVGRLPFSDPEALRPYAYKLLRAESLDAQHVSPTALVFSNGDWQGAGRKLSTRLLTLDSAGKLAPARALKPALRPKEVLKALDSNQPVVLATLTRTAFDSASPSEQRRIQGEPRLDSEHSALSAETFSGQQAALYRGAWLLVGHHGAGTPASPVYGDALAALPPDASGPVLGARSLDGRPFVSATAEAALRSESGPLVVLGHLDATFSDSLDPARTGLPVLELVLSDVMSRVLQGEPAGEAHQRFVEAARAVAEAGPGRHADTRAVARVDLGSWLLLGDPAARVPGTRGAREAARATPLDDPFDDIAPSTAPDPNADPFAASAQPPDDLTADPFAAGAQPPDDVTADPFAAPELPRDSKPHEGVVTALRFSPRGALASGGRDGRVWLAQPGAPARVIDEPDELGAVVELRFSPQGDVLLAAFADGRCRLFQVDDSAPPVTLAGDGYSLTLIGFTADGRDLITVSDHGRVVRWPERGAGEPRALPSVERVRGAALGGSILALGDEEGTLRLYDLDHGDSTQEITRAHAQALDVLGISADGRTLLSAGRQSGAAVWDLAGEKPSATHRWSTPKTMDIAGAMSADGQHVVLHFGPSGLALGRADGSLSLARGDAFGPAVNRLALLPNGALLLAHDDRSLRLWDGRGAPRSVYLEGGPLNTLAATDDGQLLAAGDADGRIVVLRARDITDPAMPPAGLVEIPPLANEPWRLLGEAGAPIRRVLAYARLRIAGTERGAVRVHDAEGALIWEGHGHGSSPVHQLAISPDADLLITASEGGRIRLTRVAPVAGWGVPLQVAGEPALALGFPSEKQAVTVTRDGRIRLH
ncbi:MAG: WD40 repeat domain-containing protein, partial [Alphaproteobacteria bacterium]|nr:WD40 repeat domain-containing protein [Alphaproteobacteria bacterium]